MKAEEMEPHLPFFITVSGQVGTIKLHKKENRHRLDDKNEFS